MENIKLLQEPSSIFLTYFPFPLETMARQVLAKNFRTAEILAQRIDVIVLPLRNFILSNRCSFSLDEKESMLKTIYNSCKNFYELYNFAYDQIDNYSFFEILYEAPQTMNIFHVHLFINKFQSLVELYPANLAFLNSKRSELFSICHNLFPIENKMFNAFDSIKFVKLKVVLQKFPDFVYWGAIKGIGNELPYELKFLKNIYGNVDDQKNLSFYRFLPRHQFETIDRLYWSRSSERKNFFTKLYNQQSLNFHSPQDEKQFDAVLNFLKKNRVLDCRIPDNPRILCNSTTRPKYLKFYMEKPNHGYGKLSDNHMMTHLGSSDYPLFTASERPSYLRSFDWHPQTLNFSDKNPNAMEIETAVYTSLKTTELSSAVPYSFLPYKVFVKEFPTTTKRWPFMLKKQNDFQSGSENKIVQLNFDFWNSSNASKENPLIKVDFIIPEEPQKTSELQIVPFKKSIFSSSTRLNSIASRNSQFNDFNNSKTKNKAKVNFSYKNSTEASVSDPEIRINIEIAPESQEQSQKSQNQFEIMEITEVNPSSSKTQNSLFSSSKPFGKTEPIQENVVVDVANIEVDYLDNTSENISIPSNSTSILQYEEYWSFSQIQQIVEPEVRSISRTTRSFPKSNYKVGKIDPLSKNFFINSRAWIENEKKLEQEYGLRHHVLVPDQSQKTQHIKAPLEKEVVTILFLFIAGVSLLKKFFNKKK